MKKVLLLGLMVFMSVLGVRAQAYYTFKAGMLNVDGLPATVAGGLVDVNPEGPGADGALLASEYLAKSGWDIIALAEDFNYHTELTSVSSTYYNYAAHGGTVSITLQGILNGLRCETDGLGMAVSKWIDFPELGTEGTRVEWSSFNGKTDQGADGLITKGFRMYTIPFSSTAKVDVYVLHMDADSGEKDIAVREEQLTELATYIKNHHNNRPVIVIGDTNCRYTRDRVKALFLDVLNADARFTAKDAWIELIRNNEYPNVGDEALMTHTYGAQHGEVVDKVFYINTTQSDLTLEANSYWNDAAKLKVSDHTPVMVQFTLTDPDGVAVDQTFPGPDDETPETWTDAAVTSPTQNITGKQYYLRNVSSGLFFKAGNNWGAHFGEGQDGLPVEMTLVSGNTYKLATPTLGRFVGNNGYNDNGDTNMGNWVVQEVKSSSNKGNNKTKYIFTGTADVFNGKTIASNGNGAYVDAATKNVNDTKQQWELMTYDEMIATIQDEMASTISGTYYNASGLMTQPVCNLALDTRHNSGWSSVPSIGGAGGENNAPCVWEVFRDGASHAFEMTQTLTGIPNGTYKVRVQAFFRDGDLNTSSRTAEPVLVAGNKTQNICSILDGALTSRPSWTHGHQNSAGWIPNDMWQANQWFKAGYYWVEIADVKVTNGTLTVGIKNTSTKTSQAWCCFDNFQLMYLGTSEGDLKASALYKEIKAEADAALAQIENMPDEVKQSFDIADVKWRYENGLISLDGSVEKAIIAEALTDAIKNQSAENADLTLAITNHSFEMGDLTGWTVQNANDTGVKKSEGNIATVGVDGTYLFNTWSGAGEECSPLKQTITHLKSGYYKLSALVTSFAANSVYLVANDQYKGVATPEGEGVFVEHSVNFLVEDGVADIATVGSYNGKFNYPKGAFFKSDNYRLTYLGSLAQGRVEIALADAKERANSLTAEAKAQFLAAVAKYENMEVDGDGIEEKQAIYTALKEATLSQRVANAEMTWAIRNHSFETSDLSGWTVPAQWDTRVDHQSSNIYANNADGLYLFNQWNDWVDPNDNKPIQQTITGLPNGTYRLTASVTSYAGKKVYVFGNGTAGEGAVATAESEMVETSVEFQVTDGTATIGAVGALDGEFNEEGGCFYKVDNFRLTFVNNDVILNETDKEMKFIDGDWCTSVTLNRNIKANTWSTFVVPFNMEIPAGWEVKELTSAVMKDDVISMTFGNANTIVAGTPYMVRAEEEWSGTTVGNTTLTDALTDVNGSGLVTFKGNYISGNVPEGMFFMNKNNFYQAVDNTNTLKAFRGYFEVTASAGANKLAFVIDGEETAINGVEADSDATIVAIYSLDGRRIESMQRGVNIVKLSDGKTKKVIVK